MNRGLAGLFLLIILRSHPLHSQTLPPSDAIRCTTDTDCFSQFAVCPDAIGLSVNGTSDRSCVCTLGNTFTNGRCTTNGSSSAVLIERGFPLYYLETRDAGDSIDFVNGRPSLPSVWWCDPTQSFCSANSTDTSVQLFIHDSDTVSALSANDSTTLYISLSVIQWRCADRMAYPVIPPLSATIDSLLYIGMTEFSSAFCALPATNLTDGNCSYPNGSASADSMYCNCDPTYAHTDARCQTPIADLQVSIQYVHTDPSPLVGQCVYNSDCPANMACMRAANPFDFSYPARCGCAHGYFKALGNSTCTDVDAYLPSRITHGSNGLLKLPASSLPAVVHYSNMGTTMSTFDGSMRTVFRTYVYRDPASALLPIASEYSTSSNIYWWNCDSDAELFYDSQSNRHCSGCATVCGPNTNCSASDPITGTCVCMPGWSGDRCDTCSGGFTGPFCNETEPDCGTNRCAGYGTCIPGKYGCTCAGAWYGDSCSLPLAACRAAHCGGSEFVNSTCVFNTGCYDVPRSRCRCRADPPMFGPFCNQTAAKCSEERCSGAGDCVWDTETQCVCPPWRSSMPDCSVAQCVNGGMLNQYTGKCVCPSAFTGDYCQDPVCYRGTWNMQSHSCDCYGVYGQDPTGNCTEHMCGPAGEPTSDGTACKCKGNRRDMPGFNPRCRDTAQMLRVLPAASTDPIPAALLNINNGSTIGTGTQSTNTENSNWRTATIILSVLVGLFLVVAVSTYSYWRLRQRKYQAYRSVSVLQLTKQSTPQEPESEKEFDIEDDFGPQPKSRQRP